MRPDRQTAHVHRYRHDDPRAGAGMLTRGTVVATRNTGGRHGRRGRRRTDADAASTQPGLHPLPFGTAVLEPDLHLRQNRVIDFKAAQASTREFSR